MHELPHRRRDDLLVETFADSIVIYDVRTQTAHALNGDAARVWETLDGASTSDEIAQRLELADPTLATILSRLDALDLLDQPAHDSISRRAALRRLAGLGGMALTGAGLITSVAVPSAAASASTCNAISCGYNSTISCADAQNEAAINCTTSSSCQFSSTCIGGTCTESPQMGFTFYEYQGGTCSY